MKVDETYQLVPRVSLTKTTDSWTKTELDSTRP